MKKTCQIIAAVALLGFVACVQDDGLTDAPQQPDKAVIVNNPEGAMAGEIIIKFRPKVTGLLDQAGATRCNTRGQMTRSGITTLDQVLDIIGTLHIERVFPTNNKETQTRESGLHLWYLVKFDEGTDVQKAAEELAQLGEIAKIQYSQELKRTRVERAVPLRGGVTQATAGAQAAAFNDPLLGDQWHYINSGDQALVPYAKAGSDVNCAGAWPTCTGDSEIIVAVMDEGVDWAHPDLADNMWVNENEVLRSDKDNDGNGYAGDVYGYNFVHDSGNVICDSNGSTGHGTHVAGTIAAVNNNGMGVCGIAGGSGNKDGVKIMSVQIFDGMEGVLPYNEARGVKYAADNGAVVLQCSWGYNSSLADPATTSRGFATDEQWAYYCPLEKEAFDYFIHNAGSPNGVIEGGIVVFASGNEYAAAAGYPAAFKDFICVAALAADYTPASYTNYAIGVDVSAPGGDQDYHKTAKGSILSTMPASVNDGELYGYMDGTSMACPHVSGVVALGLSYAAKLHKHFKAADYRDLVIRSTRDLSFYLTGTKLYYKYWSYAGEAAPVRMELGKYYQGNMGTGLVDAELLLANVAQNGVKLDIPNVYVSAGETQSFAPTRFFDNGETLTFTAASKDTTVATATVADGNITVSGVKNGSTTYTVTASNGQTQTGYITVRKQANDNGWF